MLHVLRCTLLAAIVCLPSTFAEDASALIEAAKAGDVEQVRALLKKGAPVDAADEKGWTALLQAVENGKKDVVEVLISAGADIHKTNNKGSTPLYASAVGGHKDIAETLIRRGAKVGARRKDGSTPLHGAAIFGHRDVAELLIDNRADVNAKDNISKIPLHHVAIRGHRDVTELLIARGADVNAKDTLGVTPLYCAVLNGHKDIVQLLVSKGAVYGGDLLGRTVLHMAAEKGHTDIVELLIAKGFDVNAKDSRGATPLDLARQKGYQDVVDLLSKHSVREGTEMAASPVEARPSAEQRSAAAGDEAEKPKLDGDRKSTERSEKDSHEAATNLPHRGAENVATDTKTNVQEGHRVYLRDGRVLEGIVKAETEDKVVFEYIRKGNFRSIPRSEVKKIEKCPVTLDASVAIERGAETREENLEKEREKIRAWREEEERKRRENEIDFGGLVLFRDKWHGKNTDIGCEVTGIVENRTGRHLHYVEIRIAILDQAGNQLDTLMTNMTDLAPGGRWQFKAAGFRGGSSFKVIALEGW